MASRTQPARETPPRPVESPCPTCDDARWRFNGRAWWACDPATGRRHVCSPPAQLDPQPTLPEPARRGPRVGTALGLGLAAAVAVLAGTWLYASHAE